MAALDVISKSSRPLVKEDSNIGSISSSFGGVGRNVAETIARLGKRVTIHTVVGPLFSPSFLPVVTDFGP